MHETDNGQFEVKEVCERMNRNKNLPLALIMIDDIPRSSISLNCAPIALIFPIAPTVPTVPVARIFPIVPHVLYQIVPYPIVLYPIVLYPMAMQPIRVPQLMLLILAPLIIPVDVCSSSLQPRLIYMTMS